MIPATLEAHFTPGSKYFRAILGLGTGLYMVNQEIEGVRLINTGWTSYSQPFQSKKSSANFGLNPQLGFRIRLSKTVFLDALYRMHLVKSEENWDRMNALSFGLTLYFDEPDHGDED
ncbi:MAG TPA: hypothetical protein PKY12_01175 [Catalimonadaceae bacterium]|nr:hypothetical protein [Catalimonadaceae bacterium]